MQIEVVAIGEEILLGNIVNTNATFISCELKKMGYSVSRHSVYSDTKDLKKNILESLNRSNLLIVTGGLGPTFDDKTKKVIFDIFNKKTHLDKNLLKELAGKFGDNKYIRSQAYIPDSDILKNDIGSAPGFVLEKSSKLVIALPGVPIEMRAMFEKAKKYIRKKFLLKEKIYQETCSLCLVKENEVEPILEKMRRSNKDVEIGIYPHFANIKISFTSKDKKKVSFLKKEIKKVFSKFFFKEDCIEKALRDVLLKKNQTVAFAESCSGGAISKSFISIPNVSKCFLGSFVVYANELKKNILQVKPKTLEKFGAVSKQTVVEMLTGIFDKTSANYAIAITGIAGPGGGSKKKPVGTVCIAIGKRNEAIDVGVLHINGNRKFVIEYAKSFAISLLYAKIKFGLTYFFNEL